eukprot:scaffold31633_cov96-Isochrysis_galbana.AAC.2
MSLTNLARRAGMRAAAVMAAVRRRGADGEGGGNSSEKARIDARAIGVESATGPAPITPPITPPVAPTGPTLATPAGDAERSSPAKARGSIRVHQRVVRIEARESRPAAAAEPARVPRLETLRRIEAWMDRERRRRAEAGKPVMVASDETRDRHGQTCWVSRAGRAVACQVSPTPIAKQKVIGVLVRVKARGEAAASRSRLSPPLRFGRTLSLQLQPRAVGGADAGGVGLGGRGSAGGGAGGSR